MMPPLSIIWVFNGIFFYLLSPPVLSILFEPPSISDAINKVTAIRATNEKAPIINALVQNFIPATDRYFLF